ncbi:MAG: tetratricopeptide repeat protein [Hyphomicrobiaceae bacterium]
MTAIAPHAASQTIRRLLLAATATLMAALPLAADAQTANRSPAPPGVDDGTAGKGKQGAPPALPQAKPDAGAAASGDQARKPDKKPNRLPQTAQEKAKALSDLYALLQTAEDEAAAKKVADQIERMWAHSGSDTINLLLQRSSKAIHDKKKELAQKLLDSAVELAPDQPEVFNQRAFFHFTENNYEAAVGDLRRVLAIDPNHYKALEGLAQIWRETGNKKGAYKVMQQLLEVHPHAPGAKQIHDELKKEVDGQGI